MNRKIKFRAWDNDNKSYLYDVQDTYGENEYCFGNFLLDNERYVIEQFTGSKDVNGKDIYEGDIVEATIDGYVQADKYLVKNTWDPHVWVEESDPYYAVSKMEVVGNIHNNPELLED